VKMVKEAVVSAFDHATVGVNLFATCSVAKASINQSVKSLLPFVGMVIFCLMLVAYIPDILLGLSDWLYEGAVR
jgi:TRAP-type C4-dicarboxylate transport system permease large subunit